MGYGGKIQLVNNAIRESLLHLKEAAAENHNTEMLLRVVKFSNGASWHVANPVPVELFNWVDLEASGAADMGKALQLVAEQLDQAVLPQRVLPPVLVLISCSKPTDDANIGLRALMDQPWGRKAIRIAVAVGDEVDRSVLQRFIGDPELKPLQANDTESLVRYIKWFSMLGESAMPNIPGGPLARRPLHFIWIADCSGSMSGKKIESLNFAIHTALPHMKEAAAENPNAEVMVRAVKFSSGASWHISNAVEVEQLDWIDLDANGVTDMGKALQLVAEQLNPDVMPERGLPPVLVLLSDGQPTDDVSAGLRELMAQPWGTKAVRIAIAIGEDANNSVLQRFIGHPELEPLQANNAESLVKFIKWATTEVLKSASSPPSQAQDAGKGTNVHIPPAPAPVPNANVAVDDVW